MMQHLPILQVLLPLLGAPLAALLRGRDISFQAGGGIVADSQPPVEYEETLNKARGLALALGEDIDRFTALASPAPVSEQAG